MSEQVTRQDDWCDTCCRRECECRDNLWYLLCWMVAMGILLLIPLVA